MIVQLTGTLVEAMPTYAVLDVNGVGYEMGISHQTAAELPSVGSAGITLLTRLVVREDAMELYGFISREERALFDKLVAITGVGPKLALAVLSTYKPAALATIVATADLNRLAQVPGIGKRKAQRLLVDLEQSSPMSPRPQPRRARASAPRPSPPSSRWASPRRRSRLPSRASAKTRPSRRCWHMPCVGSEVVRDVGGRFRRPVCRRSAEAGPWPASRDGRAHV